jgi:glycosyltransferase involved in cell wall biosynthesis
MKTIAVIPAWKEEKKIGSVIRETKKYVDKVIVIDDGSPDKTAEVSRKLGAQVIRYEENRGVGFATKIGLEKAISLNPEIIVFLDADGQHDPNYIPYFLNAIKNGADYACGKRDLSKYPFNRKIGNLGLKILTNLLCPTGIMDTECGFRALSLRAAKKLSLKAERYEREMDFAYEVWKNKFKIKQIEIKVSVFHSKAAIGRGFKNFFFLIKRRINFEEN